MTIHAIIAAKSLRATKPCNLAYTYAHRKSRAPKLCKRQCFPTVDPASYILACTYGHRKSQGPTGRNCNTAMGRFPNPAKHSVSQALPQTRHLTFSGIRVCASQLASSKNQVEIVTWPWEGSQTRQNTVFPYIPDLASYILAIRACASHIA